MKEIALGISELRHCERAESLNNFKGNELLELCKVFAELGREKKFDLGFLSMSESILKRLSEAAKKQAINKLLKQFPKVQGDTLALDKTVADYAGDFKDQKDKLDEIITDLNSDLLEVSRFWELIHENLYEVDVDYDNERNEFEIEKYYTFLGYAAPKLKPYVLKELLVNLRAQLGQEQFDIYVTLGNKNGIEGSKLNVFQMYLDNCGSKNIEERQSLSSDSKRVLSSFIPKSEKKEVNDVNNRNTHNVSNHKSADESHVAAFKAMVSFENLDVSARYERAFRHGDPSRAVSITRRNSFKNFTNDKLGQLQQKVDSLLNMRDADVYNNYLRYNDAHKFTCIEYKDLEKKDKGSFDKKIKGLRFQASAAKRYIDLMHSKHECSGGEYLYYTNEPQSCGLTIEEIIATAFWACSNKANFRDMKGSYEQQRLEEINFILLVKSIYDLKRGYNVDRGIDRPEDNKYPVKPGVDLNRCDGGAVNSLASALSSTHKCYNIKTIERSDLEREIKKVYQEIVVENWDKLKTDEYKKSLIVWCTTGVPNNKIRRFIKKSLIMNIKMSLITTLKVILIMVFMHLF